MISRSSPKPKKKPEQKGTSVALALIEQVARYESDTFSAALSKLTRAEAEQVAERLITWWSKRNLDGIAIRGALDEVRRG